MSKPDCVHIVLSVIEREVVAVFYWLSNAEEYITKCYVPKEYTIESWALDDGSLADSWNIEPSSAATIEPETIGAKECKHIDKTLLTINQYYRPFKEYGCNLCGEIVREFERVEPETDE